MSLISKELHLLTYIYLLGNPGDILKFHDCVFELHKSNIYLISIINCNKAIGFVLSAHFANRNLI